MEYAMKMAVKDLMQLSMPLTTMISLYRRISSLNNGSGDGKQQGSREVIQFYPRRVKATPKFGVNVTQNGWEVLSNRPCVALPPCVLDFPVLLPEYG